MFREEEILISSVAQLPLRTPTEFSSAELLHAAFAHSSIGIAVCDHDFSVRFLNPAIARLIQGRAGATDVAHRPSILRMLGIDEAEAMADILSRGSWRGIGAPGDLGTDREMHVIVEAFDANNVSGWLITAHVNITRHGPASLSDHQLIALSDKLTARECEVMLALQEGASNKAIARRLDISPRTVEFHRSRIMQRFSAKSVVDLVRKVTRDARTTL